MVSKIIVIDFKLTVAKNTWVSNRLDALHITNFIGLFKIRICYIT